jgi:hypothetical protein
MSTQADQKFMAVADKEPGEMSVYKIDNEKNAIANLEHYKNQRNLTHKVYSSPDKDSAIQYAKGLYPNHHYMPDFLTTWLQQSSQ